MKNKTSYSYILIFSYCFVDMQGNPSCQQKERIIKCLPLFVHGLRETSNSLIQEDVTSLIRSGTNEIKVAIGKYLASLVCVTFGCGKISVENSKVVTKCQRDEQRGKFIFFAVRALRYQGEFQEKYFNKNHQFYKPLNVYPFSDIFKLF